MRTMLYGAAATTVVALVAITLLQTAGPEPDDVVATGELRQAPARPTILMPSTAVVVTTTPTATPSPMPGPEYVRALNGARSMLAVYARSVRGPMVMAAAEAARAEAAVAREAERVAAAAVIDTPTPAPPAPTSAPAPPAPTAAPPATPEPAPPAPPAPTGGGAPVTLTQCLRSGAGGVISEDALHAIVAQHAWGGYSPADIAWTFMEESSGCIAVVSPTDDHGVCQIHAPAHPGVNFQRVRAEPAYAVAVCNDIFHAREAAGGCGICAWHAAQGRLW